MSQERLRIVESHIKEMRLSTSSDKARRDLLLEQKKQKQEEIDLNNGISEMSLQARHLFENLTDKKRELVRAKIENLVTTGIQSVYGANYEFKIEQKLARNQVTFDYKIITTFEGSKVTSDLRGFHGGGLVALVGFLLRVVMVLFVHPPRRRILFLDETMAALDGDKRGPFAALMKNLGEQLDMQFVMISHSNEYSADADKVYEIRSVSDGISTFFPLN